jgi:hypothetical protein
MSRLWCNLVRNIRPPVQRLNAGMKNDDVEYVCVCVCVCVCV